MQNKKMKPEVMSEINYRTTIKKDKLKIEITAVYSKLYIQ